MLPSPWLPLLHERYAKSTPMRARWRMSSTEAMSGSSSGSAAGSSSPMSALTTVSGSGSGSGFSGGWFRFRCFHRDVNRLWCVFLRTSAEHQCHHAEHDDTASEQYLE